MLSEEIYFELCSSRRLYRRNSGSGCDVANVAYYKLACDGSELSDPPTFSLRWCSYKLHLLKIE